MSEKKIIVEDGQTPIVITAEGRDVLLLRKLLEQQTIAARALLLEPTEKTLTLLTQAVEISEGILAAMERAY